MFLVQNFVVWLEIGRISFGVDNICLEPFWTIDEHVQDNLPHYFKRWIHLNFSSL